jgi:selenocysteine-specific elongation factor
MKSLILGTAGHVDHGKTALVKALTGVDTDRLKEEKERGITIELGFAPLVIEPRVIDARGRDVDGARANGRLRFGVVDVPGHEDFVRAMVAGAAGMDVVLLVVAADEGVMPQTREHVAIVQTLGVPELVVALTKCDLVDDDWLELVDADVAQLLTGTPYAQARRIPTSATRSTGLAELTDALAEAADRTTPPDADDLMRLPLDRVFVIQGTGTVVTGTLWSGTLRAGDRVVVLPAGLEARVRSLQVHAEDVEEAHAGERTAVALSGAGADRERVERGAVLVSTRDWPATSMLTVRASMLADSEWSLVPRQRVHVHHGTAEVLGRCVLLDAEEIGPGETGWVQLRLEEPLAARAGDRIVLRAYSPVTTIGGAVVVEPMPPKRTRLDDTVARALGRILDGDPADVCRGALDLAGLRGIARAELPIVTGLTPSTLTSALAQLEHECLSSAHRVFGAGARAEAEALALAAAEQAHARHPLRGAVPLASVREAFPRWASQELADATVALLVQRGELEPIDGGVRRPGHRPTPSADQETASARLAEIFRAGGLGAPSLDELPEGLARRDDLWDLLRRLEALGVIRQVSDDIFLESGCLDAAAARIRSELGGRRDLGPAAFRDVLPVSRKRLLPLLSYFDGRGTTRRRDEVRDVPDAR